MPKCPFCKKEYKPWELFCAGCGSILPDREIWGFSGGGRGARGEHVISEMWIHRYFKRRLVVFLLFLLTLATYFASDAIWMQICRFLR